MRFPRGLCSTSARPGRILAWDPPRRLVYEWHLRQDRADATELEIRFDRREANRRGWAGLLPHYRGAI
jgi:uncharacterized protein YndB with AHSA1/START domain